MTKLSYEEIKCIIQEPGVYYIKCKNHNYVGSSVSLKDRLLAHRNDLIKKNHRNKHMQNIFNKYGEDVFQFSILEVLTTNNIEQIRLCEKKWIDILGPSLNHELDPVTQRNSTSQSKVVYQYKLNGEYVTTYPSTSEAGRVLNIPGTMISACARGEILSAGKYYWSYEPITNYRYSVERSKWKWISVRMTVLETGEEHLFKNIAEAAKYIAGKDGNVNSISASISAVIAGKGKTVHKKYTFTSV